MSRPSRYDLVLSGIRGQIASGAWPPGHRIPTAAVLAQMYGAGITTVRTVIRDLVRSGELETQHGVGVYVAGGPQ